MVKPLQIQREGTAGLRLLRAWAAPCPHQTAIASMHNRRYAARASSQPPRGSRAGRIGAAVMLLLWLTLTVLVAIWASQAFALDRGCGLTPNPLTLPICQQAASVRGRGDLAFSSGTDRFVAAA